MISIADTPPDPYFTRNLFHPPPAKGPAWGAVFARVALGATFYAWLFSWAFWWLTGRTVPLSVDVAAGIVLRPRTVALAWLAGLVLSSAGLTLHDLFLLITFGKR